MQLYGYLVITGEYQDSGWGDTLYWTKKEAVDAASKEIAVLAIMASSPISTPSAREVASYIEARVRAHIDVPEGDNVTCPGHRAMLFPFKVSGMELNGAKLPMAAGDIRFIRAVANKMAMDDGLYPNDVPPDTRKRYLDRALEIWGLTTLLR